MRKDSIKYMRINGEIQRTLGDIIRSGIKDPRIVPMTCVTDVDVTTDLKECKVYISAYSKNNELKNIIEGLKSAEPYIRKMLAKKLNLRNTPKLIFLEDNSIEYGEKMNKLINEVSLQIPEAEDEESL